MAKDGPIILVEDDKDDQELVKDILGVLNVGNKLIIFDRSLEALDYLQKTKDKPFIIFSDVNMPEQNGIEFKRQIDVHPNLRKKCIPFIFLSTSVNQRAVNDAFLNMSVQGFFQKASSYNEMKKMLAKVLDYWH